MSEERKKLSPFAEVKAEALRQNNSPMSEAEINEAAEIAAEQARETFGKMVEAGADPWTAREQILHELSQEPEKPKPRPRSKR